MKFVPGCCGCGPHPPPCTFTVTVVEVGSNSPITGVPISISGSDGTPGCSGETDDSGQFTCTITTTVPASPVVTATYGGCSYSGAIYCGEPLTLYYCSGSIDYRAIDDSGATASGISYYAQPLGLYSYVLSMSGGGPGPYGFGTWNSMNAGTAVFCWFGPAPPSVQRTSYGCSGTIPAIGFVNVYPFPVPRFANPNLPTNNGTYWSSPTCGACVYCGNNTPFYPVFYRYSMWLANDGCEAGNCVAGVNHTNAIPKAICITISGPGEIFGTDAGNAITLGWDSTTSDGSSAATAPYMLFDSGCLGGNGAGGYCYSLDSNGCTITGAFTAYGSRRIRVLLSGKSGILQYTNYWGGGCPNPDPAPMTCPPIVNGVGRAVVSPLYCPTSCGPANTPRDQDTESGGGSGVNYTAQYPMDVTLGLQLSCTDNTFQSSPGAGIGFQLACPPYTITTLTGDGCGVTPSDPSGPSGPMSMMVGPPIESADASDPIASIPSYFPASDDPSKIKIGFLCPVLNMGGAEAWQLMLARNLPVERFHLSGVAVLGPEGEMSPEMVAMHRVLMPLANGYHAARMLAMACDILITWAIDGLPGILEGLEHPPRVVAAVHAPPESPWGQTVYARPEGIDRWVAVSECALDALPPSSRIVPASIIWNAVDETRLEIHRETSAVRESWGVPPDSEAKVALYLGRISHEKRAELMGPLSRSLPDPWHVVVVGDGHDRPRLEAMAGSRMHVVGPDPAIGDVLGAADVVVIPSDYESFCLVMAEALWLGKPVVSTDVGLAKMVPGLTYPIPFDADGPTLAHAVQAAMLDDRRAAFEPIRSRLGRDRFTREWAELLSGLVGDHRKPSMVRRARNFGRAVVSQVVAGFPIASEDVQATRKAICLTCPLFDLVHDLCSSCGCGAMDLKRSWATQACPEGKWPAVSAGPATPALRSALPVVELPLLVTGPRRTRAPKGKRTVTIRAKPARS